MIWRCSLLLLVIQGTFAIPICPNQQNSKEHVVLGALLPLHSGEDCSAIQIKGIQQLAALEYGLNAANSDLGPNGDMKISLQILDTCSNANRAVKATMKGLVSAEQTCLKSPLFLGYIGPDDQELLYNVQKITSLLNKTHVLPYKIDLKDRTPNVFFVGTDQTSKRANAINTMLRNLGWETYVPVVEDSTKVTNVLGALFNLSNGRICPVDKTLLLPKTQNGYASIYREIIESQIRSSANGVLVIVDIPEALGPLLNILSNSDSTQRPPFVVYVMTVGIKLSEIPRSDAASMILMQESTESKLKNEIKQYFNESLLVTYREQNRKGLGHNCSVTESAAVCLDPLEDELDSSVMPITYSIHLFANALRMAIDKKCKNELHYLGVCRSVQSMQSAEWMSVMKTATTILNGEDGPKRIRFQMETTHHVSVYMADVITKQVDLVAKMTNGDRLNFIKNVFLPASTRMTTSFADRPSLCQLYESKLSKPTTMPTPDEEDVTVAREEDDWSPIWEFLPNSEKDPKKKDTYPVAYVLLFIGLGFLLFMIITIRILYKMFTFSQGNDHNSSKKKKKASKRRSRRASSVSSRRVSRTRSIASTRST